MPLICPELGYNSLIVIIVLFSVLTDPNRLQKIPFFSWIMLFAEVFAVPHYVLRRDGWLCDGLQCRRKLGAAVDKKIHPQKSCFVSCNYEQLFLQNDGEASIVPKTARIWTAGFTRALTNAPTSAIVLAVSGRLPATGLKGGATRCCTLPYGQNFTVTRKAFPNDRKPHEITHQNAEIC